MNQSEDEQPELTCWVNPADRSVVIWRRFPSDALLYGEARLGTPPLEGDNETLLAEILTHFIRSPAEHEAWTKLTLVERFNLDTTLASEALTTLTESLRLF